MDNNAFNVPLQNEDLDESENFLNSTDGLSEEDTLGEEDSLDNDGINDLEDSYDDVEPEDLL